VAWTADQLAALDAAIASGTLTVEFENRRVTYQNLEQLLKLRSLMVADIAGSVEGAAPSNYRLAATTKGV
jgi:hypothetical protein